MLPSERRNTLVGFMEYDFGMRTRDVIGVDIML
jgi:hypothetical protein